MWGRGPSKAAQQELGASVSNGQPDLRDVWQRKRTPTRDATHAIMNIYISAVLLLSCLVAYAEQLPAVSLLWPSCSINLRMLIAE